MIYFRAYSPAIIHPFVGLLSDAMLVVALFDREVNCRRAASAAFQENVGRQGMENFPCGIEVTSRADYFSLGVRAVAYLDVAPAVSKLSDGFATTIVNHLRFLLLQIFYFLYEHFRYLQQLQGCALGYRYPASGS